MTIPLTFSPQRFIRRCVTLCFERTTGIADRLEDLPSDFTELFPNVQRVDLPDTIDPEMLRVLFTSASGYSQIYLSQVSAMLDVSYSDDWQVDESRADEYSRDRAQRLVALQKYLFRGAPLYGGVTTVCRLPWDGPARSLGREAAWFLPEQSHEEPLAEVDLRLARIVDRTFYSNITFKTYREWPPSGDVESSRRFPLGSIVGGGIEIVCDYTDRAAYSEMVGYKFEWPTLDRMLELSRLEVMRAVEKVLTKGAP